MANKLEQQYPQFFELNGTALNDGYIYIGVNGLNPETNPIPIFLDEDLTTPISQPLRTSGGYIYYNGSPVSIYFNESTYSITVKNSLSNLIYTILSNNAFSYPKVIDTIEDLATYTGTGTGLVMVKDINRGGTFIHKTAIEIDPNTGSLYVANDVTVFAKLGGGFWVRQQYNVFVNIGWSGAKGDGIQDDSLKFISASAIGKPIVLSNDSYKVDSGDFTNVVFISYNKNTTTNNSTIKIRYFITEEESNVISSNLTENSNRSIIQYRSAHEIRISGGLMSFSGFRFKGQYQNKATKSLFQDGNIVVSSNSLPWGMTTRKQESWYGVFACANENDTSITYRCVPFMRIHSSTGAGSFYLSENTGEAKHVVGNTFSYGYNSSLINGRDVLICSETIDSRTNAMSGRVTKINNVGVNSLGFVENGGIGALDYILIAPDFDHYRYCGSFYEDTAEIRNIADSGSIVVTRGINQMTYPLDGSITAATSCSVAGYISPLATTVILNDYFVINSTAVGGTGTRFLIDNVHDIVLFNPYKVSTETSFQSQQIFIPFAFKQEYWAFAVGLTTRTNEKHNIYGWVEE